MIARFGMTGVGKASFAPDSDKISEKRHAQADEQVNILLEVYFHKSLFIICPLTRIILHVRLKELMLMTGCIQSI